MTTQNNDSSLLNDKMVDMKFITEFTGLTDKWFYKMISEGQFPKPIKLGRSSRWMQHEVENWLQKRIDQSRN
ncbi:AlpA family transcriptional regulator [Phytobacter ursingii]|uniref:AlpA family transcriptional regulator n=1 Tax=Phytobacter ursingii TaxID=1972431 RepID=A0AB35RJ86_9ENTR|nr:AlpA family transcriptional regulator [Phytobacter ursingii]MDV2862128.1 AlpA family transcriptional regulator [Phytobacter ursingii]